MHPSRSSIGRSLALIRPCLRVLFASQKEIESSEDEQQDDDHFIVLPKHKMECGGVPLTHIKEELHMQPDNLLEDANPDMLIQLYVNNSEHLVEGLRDQDALYEEHPEQESTSLQHLASTHFLSPGNIADDSTLANITTPVSSSVEQLNIIPVQVRSKAVGQSKADSQVSKGEETASEHQPLQAQVRILI